VQRCRVTQGVTRIALCCAVLCCAVLCCAVLCCAVLCCAVLCCAVLCCAVLCLCVRSNMALYVNAAWAVIHCGMRALVVCASDVIRRDLKRNVDVDSSHMVILSYVLLPVLRLGRCPAPVI
jgi:hypothetical protein